MKDERWAATPLGWALYGLGEATAELREPRYEAVALLVDAGSAVLPEWLENEDTDDRLLTILRRGRKS